MRMHRALPLFVVLLAPTALAAQSQTSLPELPRVEGATITLDGRLDEAAWNSAAPVDLGHQLRPREGARPSEATEVRIFYDHEALYIGARLRERDPRRMVRRAVERNSFHRYDQDGFAVILDTNLDARTAFGFIVTPGGARTDMAVFDEANVSWNTDWNAFWDAATTTDEAGWTLEMRIPFSSLRFEADDDGGVRMGMILWRYLARNDEFATFPAIPNRWGNSAYKPGQGTPVVFRGIEPVNPLYIKPYLLGGVERRPALAEGGNAWIGESDPTLEVGGDIKYNVTSSLVLDLTVNTDFAQVEADDQRFNLERFPLFFPEKRDFFQERSDLFNFRLPGGSDRLFHSRRIGIASGVPIPIQGGARLTGRQGNWELGLLNMQTGSAVVNGVEVPGENFGVVRVQRPVLDQGSYVGTLFTSRTDLDGTTNLVYAADADLHMGHDNYLGIQAGISTDRGASSGSGRQASLILQRRVNRGLSFGYSFQHLGEGFNAGVGFISRDGLNRSGNRTQYTWFPSGGPLLNHSLAHRFEFIWDHRFAAMETAGSTLTWNARFRNGASARWGLEYAWDRLDAPFNVGGLTVPAGEYEFVAGSVGFGSPSGSALQVGGSLEGGGYFGGHRLGGSLDLSWTPDPRLAVGLQNVVNRINLPAGRSDVLISRLRVGTALSRTLSAQALVQYNSSGKVVAPNIRIRYNPKEGSDLFIVYNEAMNTDLLPGDPELPRLPRSQFRALQLKYTYTFVR